MTEAELKGKWDQVRGKLKQKYGQLTDSDLTFAEGKSQELFGRLAEKVGRKELIAINCYRLAKALARQDRKPEALPHARRAVEIFTALRSPNLEVARRSLAECES